MEKTKVCLFIRCSLEKQDYDYQVNSLKSYCKSKNYQITKIIATKISGTKKTIEERKDLQELMESARKHLFSKIIITELCRISRQANIVRNVIDELSSLHISIVFRNFGDMESLMPDNTQSLISRLLIAIYSELAAEDARNISFRTRLALQNLKLNHNVVLGRRVGSGMTRKQLLKKYYKLSKDIGNGLSLQKCMVVHNISKNTVLKVKRALKS